MAPKGGGRGGGGGGGGRGGRVNVCPGAFANEQSVTPFVRFILFFILYLGVFFAYFPAKKQAKSKAILGFLWLGGVVLMLLSNALLSIATIVRECDRSGADAASNYYHWVIPSVIFSNFGAYLLLVLVTWTLNTTLRRQFLANSKATLFKIAYAAILGVMFCLTVALTGIESYNFNVMANQYNFYSSSTKDELVYEQIDLEFAYWLLYLFAALVAGAVSFLHLFQMRKRRVTTYNLPILLSILLFSTFFFALFAVINYGSQLPKISSAYLKWETVQAFWYLVALFQAVAFITLMRIAKSPAFETLVTDPVAYNTGAPMNGVNGYYQSQPPVMVR